jgi:hypothetical protein
MRQQRRAQQNGPEDRAERGARPPSTLRTSRSVPGLSPRLDRHPQAPARTAPTSSPSSSPSVMTTQRILGSTAATARHTSIPVPSGTRSSSTASAGATAGIRRAASRADPDSPTTRIPAVRSRERRPTRTSSWSSRTNTPLRPIRPRPAGRRHGPPAGIPGARPRGEVLGDVAMELSAGHAGRRTLPPPPGPIPCTACASAKKNSNTPAIHGPPHLVGSPTRRGLREPARQGPGPRAGIRSPQRNAWRR